MKRGNRGKDRRCLVAVLGAALLLAPALCAGQVSAGETPRAGALDSRVRVVNYNEWQVYSIQTSMRSVLSIEISPDETIRNVAIGDTLSWEVAPTGNILFVKQREEAKPTNAILTSVLPSGALRTYQFEFAGETGDPTMVKVKFVYPAAEAEKKRAAEEKAHQSNAAADIARNAFSGTPNYRYSITGTAAFAPADAWDNGQVTAFRFAGQTEIPAIYAVDGESEERVVQVAMQGDVAVVGTVAPAWRMRIGSAVVCLYNEAFRPAWAPRGTGTAGDTYVRELKVPSN
jgi:type IV secretion system protein VirB9